MEKPLRDIKNGDMLYTAFVTGGILESITVNKGPAHIDNCEFPHCLSLNFQNKITQIENIGNTCAINLPLMYSNDFAKGKAHIFLNVLAQDNATLIAEFTQGLLFVSSSPNELLNTVLKTYLIPIKKQLQEHSNLHNTQIHYKQIHYKQILHNFITQLRQ